MIPRYWGEKMQELWNGSVKKFTYWLLVELTVLEVREELGQIPEGTSARVRERTWIDERVVDAIERREKTTKHDLNAFVDMMRLQIILGKAKFESSFYLDYVFDFDQELERGLATLAENKDASYFHDGMTSYDTEEPAMTLLIQESARVIMGEMLELENALFERAVKHKGQLMIGRTHGQHAQPITFGVKCLNWLDMVKRCVNSFSRVREDAKVMKLSGAVGMYGTLEPRIEEMVGDRLELRPVIATQILPLDYRGRIANEMALIASVLQKIVFDLWLMSQTEVGEVREAFGKGQKGSSAMPHKKNPITLENLKGCASLVRNYAQAELEQIATAHERDISHSSVERMAFVDAFGMLDHMLRGLTKVIKTMDVFPERMLQNLELTRGTVASQKIEMLLKKNGMPPGEAYRAVQEACFQAVSTGAHLKDLLEKDPRTARYIGVDPEFHEAFDWNSWVKEEEHIFYLAGIVEE